MYVYASKDTHAVYLDLNLQYHHSIQSIQKVYSTNMLNLDDVAFDIISLKWKHVTQTHGFVAWRGRIWASWMAFTIPKMLCIFKISYKVRYASLFYEIFMKQNDSHKVKNTSVGLDFI